LYTLYFSYFSFFFSHLRFSSTVSSYFSSFIRYYGRNKIVSSMLTSVDQLQHLRVHHQDVFKWICENARTLFTDEIQELANARLGSFVNSVNTNTDLYIQRGSVLTQFPGVLKDMIGFGVQRKKGDVELLRRHERHLRPKYKTSIDSLADYIEAQFRLLFEEEGEEGHEATAGVVGVNKEKLGFDLVMKEITETQRRLAPKVAPEPRGTGPRKVGEFEAECGRLEKELEKKEATAVVKKKIGGGKNGTWVKADWMSYHGELQDKVQQMLEKEARSRTRSGRRTRLPSGLNVYYAK